MNKAKEFKDALLRAKTIAAKIAKSIKQESIKAGLKKGLEDMQRDTQQVVAPQEPPRPIVNPYGSGSGTPIVKGEMALPPQMAHIIIDEPEYLKTLEKECNVILKLDKDNKRVLLTGNNVDISFAKFRIFERMTGQPPPIEMFAPKEAEDHKNIIVQIPAIRVELIIGRGGETLKFVSETSGCKLNVPPETPQDLLNQTRSVSISGTEKAIEEARKMIEDIIGTPLTFQEVYFVTQSEEFVTELIKVPNDRVGLIIGKGGETIKMIQKECNVKLNIDTEPDDNLERPITITGTVDNVAIAKEAVFERVAGRRGILREEQYTYSYETQQFDYSAVYGQAAQGQYFDPAAYAAAGGDPNAYNQTEEFDPAKYAEGFDPAKYAAEGFDPSKYAAEGADPSQYNYDSEAYAQYYAQYYASQGYQYDPNAVAQQQDVSQEQVVESAAEEHAKPAKSARSRSTSPRRSPRSKSPSKNEQ